LTLVQLLRNLIYKPSLDDEDIMALTYYLLLQDRIDEATQLFARIKAISPSTEPLVEQKKVKQSMVFYLV